MNKLNKKAANSTIAPKLGSFVVSTCIQATLLVLSKLNFTTIFIFSAR